ncbi:MAG: hypothetical protein EBR02_03350 [Alphaproteobacteria bacterium]|nr:hypothetical protein [Alphaproteobacteria bacterium]
MCYPQQTEILYMNDTRDNPNAIDDPRCKKIIVLSDLHKYSGVSNFSKSYDPNFPVYYAMYKEKQLGEELPPREAITSKKKRREIEALVREHYGAEAIEARISTLTPEEKEAYQKEYDPHGYWARRQEIFDSFKTADHVVLNGDIFDIQCSEKPAEKIDLEAVDWLKKRMDSAPNTKFHFVLGNHEAFPEFTKAMHALEQDETYGKRFHFHEHGLRINDCLFVHGDEFLDPGHYRKALTKPGILKELGKHVLKLYERGEAFWHAAKNLHRGLLDIVSSLSKNLERLNIADTKEAFHSSKHIFYGHTHEPCAAQYNGKIFYNTGAATDSIFSSFLPLEIPMKNGKTTEVKPLLKADKEKGLIIEDPAKDINPFSFANMVTSDPDHVPASAWRL